jgi:hypothetical protein
MSCVPEWIIFYYLNWSYIPLNVIVLFHPQERTEVAKVGGWCPGSYALSECLPDKGGGSPGFQLVFTSNRILILWSNECHSQARSFLLHIQYLPHSNLLKTTYTDWNIIFMGLCIVNVFKHNQQDAMLHNGIYYYKCSTCFRRFLRPSSGAQNCVHSIRYLSSFFCFLPLSWVS